MVVYALLNAMNIQSSDNRKSTTVFQYNFMYLIMLINNCLFILFSFYFVLLAINPGKQSYLHDYQSYHIKTTIHLHITLFI